MDTKMESSTQMIEDGAPPISHTVASVTDLPIPSQKDARDSQQKPCPKTPPVLRRPSRMKHRPQDDIDVQSLLQGVDVMRQDLEDSNAEHMTRLSMQTQPHSVHLTELPVEVQESVIEYLAGHLGGVVPSSVKATRGFRNWSTAMRHPRRKQLSDLALVSKTWRTLIQERLYRHIKVKGTCSSLAECREWFTKYSHLRAHVRHLEVWVPVWEIKASRRSTDIPPTAFTHRPDIMRDNPAHVRSAIVVQDISDMTQSFQQASQNATLEDIFEITRDLFTQVYALTIEGGQGKRTPLIRIRRQNGGLGAIAQRHPSLISIGHHGLPLNPQIRSLVLKGAWNIIREPFHFGLLETALPNLQEYHCIYAKPKPRAYETICSVLRFFPPSIKDLNICLEGLTAKGSSSPDKWERLFSDHHVCKEIGCVLPDLESFSFTGRVCASLFRVADEVATRQRDSPRLKSVDLVIRNCCRPYAFPGSGNDATGIYQLDFIAAFKNLVIEAIRSLSTFTSLHYLRIRFLDLDSPNPLLNPYFHLQGNSVTGIWNGEILKLLKEVRPDAEYDCLDLGCNAGGNGEGSTDRRLISSGPSSSGGRPRSINVDAYAALAGPR